MFALVFYLKILTIEVMHGLYAMCLVIFYPFLILLSFLHGIRKILPFAGYSIRKNDVALITGSGRGLGRYLALALAQRGCNIAVVDIRGKLAEETADYIRKTYGVKCKAYKIDITNYLQLLELKSNISLELGEVTILINNAAMLTFSVIKNPPPQEIQNMIDTNFTAMVHITQLFVPTMEKLNRGHIVNVASMAALMATPIFNVYAATKAAVRNFTSSLRIEFMQQKNCQITATTVMPSYMKTERANQIMKIIDEKGRVQSIEGEIAAEYIIRAMLRGDEEVTLPQTYMWTYKLMEILPCYVKEKLLAMGTQFAWHKTKSPEYKNILKQSDIKAAM